MEPSRYKRVIGLLREAAYVLSSLLYLAPILEKLLKNWPSGSNPKDSHKDRRGSTKVNEGKDTEHE